VNPDELTEQQQRIARFADEMLRRGTDRREVESFVSRALERESTNRREGREAQGYGTGLGGKTLGAIESFTEGATLGGSGLIGDVAAAALDPNQRFGDVRAARKARESQFRESSPKLALASGLAGAVTTPMLGAGKLAASGIRGTGVLAKAGRFATQAAVEGGLQAGIEGAVRGTEDLTGEALRRALASGAQNAAVGAIAAPVVGGAVGGTSRTLARIANRGQGTPGIRTLATRFGGETPKVRDPSLLDSPDVMPVDVLEGGARQLRASMNISPVGEEVGRTRIQERGANVGPRAETALSGASGLTPQDVATSARENVARRKAASDPLYEEARQAGDIYPERTARASAPAPKPSALASVSDAKLNDEYERLLEAQNRDESLIAGLEDSPEFSESMQMPGRKMREDRRGVSIGDQTVGERNRDLAMERGRVKQRKETLSALKAEMDRRAGGDEPGFLSETGEEAALGFDALLESPIVRSAITQAKSLPQFAKLSDTDIRVLDKVYKNLGGKLRAAQRAGDGALAHDLGELQSALRTEIGERAPKYREAVQTFAGESALNDAYDAGVDLFNRPAGEVKEALRTMASDETAMFKKGVVDALRQQIGRAAPNPDLGDVARQVKGAGQVGIDRFEARDRLKEVFGPKGYLDLLKAARTEGAFSRTTAEATQNSSTAKQLRDMGIFGGLAEDATESLSLSPSATGANFLTRMVRGAVRKGRQLLNEPGEREAVDRLTQKGRGSVDNLMQLLQDELLRRESARQTGRRVGQRAAAGTRALTGER
jgi:hypothetical protein